MNWTIVVEQYDRNKYVYENIDNIALAEPLLNTHAVLICLHVHSGMRELSLICINLFKQFCFDVNGKVRIWLYRETYFLVIHMKTTLLILN